MDHRYILAWFVFIFCQVDGESLYGLKGQSISLKPTLPDKPEDILWKHNGNKVVEFNGNEEHVYRTFKNRLTLDWHTADIEITDLRYEDGGNYELEATIKNKLHRSSKTLVVIDKVPKPTISCKLIDDSSSKKSGTLECSADYNHSQTQSLLKFEWESHGNVQPGPQLTISLEDEHDDHEYICNVSNPKSSETTTFTAKDCYPDESSSVPLAVGLAILFLIIFVVLGIAYSCYRKRKACFAVKGDEESPPGSTKNVSDNHNTTAQVEEKEHLLPSSSSNQPTHTGLDVTTALGDGNSQNVNEAYQRGSDLNMNNGEAPPVRPRSALSPEAAKKEDPAVGSADLEEEKTSHQESSAAPEEPGLETTLSQSGGKLNKGEAPPVPPCSELSPAEEEVPQSNPSVSEKANEPDQADESADSEEEKTSHQESSAATEEPGSKMNKGKAPPVPPRSALSSEPAKKKDLAVGLADSSAAREEPGLETTLSESGSEQTTAQAEENSTPTDEAATDQQPDRNKDGKINKSKAPPVPPCSELSPAEEEVPQSDPSVSEKANEPKQADESADSEEDKMSESCSAAPEEPGLETTLSESGSEQTTAQAEENSTPTDEAAANPPPDMTTGSDGKTNKGKAPHVPPRSALSPEAAKKEDPAVGLADLEEEKMSHQESSAAPEEPGLETTLPESELKEAEKDGEANVPSDSVFPSEELSPLTQNSQNVAPENAAGEQSEDMDKPISETEKEPANEEKDKEKESSAAPEEPGLETTLSQSGLENNKDEHDKTGTPPTSPHGNMNKGKAPPVPPRSSLSPEPAKKADPADEPADFEEEKMSHQESSAAPEEPGLKTTLSQSGSEQTTAQAEENSTPTDEAATDQQADRNKGYVDSVRRRFDPKFCEKS